MTRKFPCHEKPPCETEPHFRNCYEKKDTERVSSFDMQELFIVLPKRVDLLPWTFWGKIPMTNWWGSGARGTRSHVATDRRKREGEKANCIGCKDECRAPGMCLSSREFSQLS